MIRGIDHIVVAVQDLEAAKKSYEQVIALYKDSSAATLATQALRRLKVIK